MNIQSPSVDFDDDHDEGKDDESTSTLESDIKSLESIEKADNMELREIKQSSEKKLSNLILEDTHEQPSSQSQSRVTSPAKPSVSSISRKSGCSKQKLTRPSYEILFISLCSMSVLSIGFYLLFYFSVLPMDAFFGSANLFNDFYLAKKQKQIGSHSSTLQNLKDVTMSRNIETDLPFFWYIPYTVDTNVIDIFGQCYHLSQASNYKEKDYLEDAVSQFSF